jgi:hypothetical protein
MTAEATDSSPVMSPASVALMIAIVMVATMPMVNSGVAILGTWLARMGFCFGGCGF